MGGAPGAVRCAGAGIAFAMCVVPRSDDLLVLQSLIQASSHGDAAVYPRALSARREAADMTFVEFGYDFL